MIKCEDLVDKLYEKDCIDFLTRRGYEVKKPHVAEYIEEAGFDMYVCSSCGWKSGPYYGFCRFSGPTRISYNGAEYAYREWKKHACSKY